MGTHGLLDLIVTEAQGVQNLTAVAYPTINAGVPTTLPNAHETPGIGTHMGGHGNKD